MMLTKSLIGHIIDSNVKSLYNESEDKSNIGRKFSVEYNEH